MGDFYHLCFAVRSIEVATGELTAALGVRWNPVRDGSLGDWAYRIVFSTAGPPFFEVIEGPPGSPWDITQTGPRFDHIGYWSADVARDRDRLSDRGAPVDFDSCPYGRSFTYHRLAGIGARVELVDLGAQQGFLETWAPGALPMPPIDLGPPGAAGER
ncbi:MULTISPECIES: VOC family protein [Pseudonocardia]|uniref:VOC domain-containing protein n=2 Tax=Pseudonocardia TaxID=1847 RepID=A0A1Y2MLW4_PSEAH|nr:MULTISPECIES: VOC family protein [Pseudonocardia]OSY35448.1 hypothetical protein BG845_06084 [Pseudonocardia autotrophica]TDN72199.1 glyoxalase/bleomycin resistance protein/dioxygenase superfamily protein [Pseudonocardia autotrophica]BBG02906.1 hypothetical protein Pdca_41150 [Pseudonocardia autotrophica]GEC27630.1 hypothetical protein PSA01_46590 [Pseudonocardia saturnea]